MDLELGHRDRSCGHWCRAVRKMRQVRNSQVEGCGGVNIVGELSSTTHVTIPLQIKMIINSRGGVTRVADDHDGHRNRRDVSRRPFLYPPVVWWRKDDAPGRGEGRWSVRAVVGNT
jgi:hypothetical protein